MGSAFLFNFEYLELESSILEEEKGIAMFRFQWTTVDYDTRKYVNIRLPAGSAPRRHCHGLWLPDSAGISISKNGITKF